MQPLGSILILMELCVSVFDCQACAGTAISIGIGNIYKLYACLGGAWVGTGSRAGPAPPLAVLFGHLQGQIVLTEPL